MPRHLPRYPVYVISKGRSEQCLTARFLAADEVPFKLVVEPQERAAYEAVFPGRVVELPFSNLGLGSIPARNWCWEDALAAGHEKHWVLDDNMRKVWRLYKRQAVPCASGPAFAAVEDFADRWSNLAIAGMNYKTFVTRGSRLPPFYLNVHVYSCLLIQNSLPLRWRGRYNEDTDLCLQVLSRGLCTALVNAFSVEKIQTMAMKGGNTAELYRGHGRLKMARSLERQWPYVVETKRKFKRPQHHVRKAWRGFDQQLIPKPGFDPRTIEPNEYGLELRQVAEEVRSPELRALLAAEKRT